MNFRNSIGNLLFIATTVVVLALATLPAKNRLLPRMARFRAHALQTSQATGEKVVRLASIENRAMPVWVQKVVVGDREIQCGLFVRPHEVQPVTPFEAGDDWLKNLTIYLYNRTNKVVAFSDVSLAFPETGNGRTEPQWMYHIELGRMPVVDAFAGSTGQPLRIDPARTPLNLFPDQTLVVRVGDYINKIQAYIQPRMPLSQISKTLIRVDQVFFDDGMRWVGGGGFSLPDASQPGRFTSLARDYFPGDMGRNYPPGY
jgi:hypothetical protein